MDKNQTVLLELSVYSILTVLLIVDSVIIVYLPVSIFSTFILAFFALGRMAILFFSHPDQGSRLNNLFEFRTNLSNNTFATLISISLISLISLILGLNGLYSISIVKASVCLCSSLLIILVGKKYSLSFYDAANLVQNFSLPSLVVLNERTTSWQKAYFLVSLVIFSFVTLDDGENSDFGELEFYLLSETGNFDDLRDEFQVGETVMLNTEIKGSSGLELTFLCTITNTENGESEEIYSDDIIIQDGISSIPLSINLLSEGPRLLNFYLYSDGSNGPVRDLYYSFEVVQ